MKEIDDNYEWQRQHQVSKGLFDWSKHVLMQKPLVRPEGIYFCVGKDVEGKRLDEAERLALADSTGQVVHASSESPYPCSVFHRNTSCVKLSGHL